MSSNLKAEMQKICPSELKTIEREPKALDLAIESQKPVAKLNFQIDDAAT